MPITATAPGSATKSSSASRPVERTPISTARSHRPAPGTQGGSRHPARTRAGASPVPARRACRAGSDGRGIEPDPPRSAVRRDRSLVQAWRGRGRGAGHGASSHRLTGCGRCRLRASRGEVGEPRDAREGGMPGESLQSAAQRGQAQPRALDQGAVGEDVGGGTFSEQTPAAENHGAVGVLGDEPAISWVTTTTVVPSRLSSCRSNSSSSARARSCAERSDFINAKTLHPRTTVAKPSLIFSQRGNMVHSPLQ